MFLRVLLFGLLVVGAAPAFAESGPTQAEVELARQLYREGKELRAKGRLQKALERFKAAHDLVATPITCLEYARSLVVLGSLVEGRELLLTASTLPKEVSESDKAARARVEARDLAAVVDQRIPRLELQLADMPRGGQVQVELDGVAWSATDIPKLRRVNPGEHVLKISWGTSTRNERFRLDESEKRTITISLGAASSQDPGAAAAARTEAAPSPRRPSSSPPAPSESGSGSDGLSALVPVGFTIGAVGITGGAVTGTLALVGFETTRACRTDSCRQQQQEDREVSQLLGTTATISLGVGGAGLLLGTIALLMDGDSQPKVGPTLAANISWQPVVAPGYVGVGGVF